MGKKAPLLALFFEAAFNVNEYIYSLKDQLRYHGKFLINNDLKLIQGAICLDTMNSPKQFTGKILLYSAIKKLSKNSL